MLKEPGSCRRREPGPAAAARCSWWSPPPASRSLFFALPLIGLLAAGRLVDRLVDDLTHRPSRRDALRLSLGLLAVAPPACRCCSACRWRGCWPGSAFPGRPLVRGLVLLPMVLPPVVGGVALLAAFSRRSPIGGWLVRRVRHPAHLLDRRGDPGRDLRGPAVLRDHRRGRAAHHGPALRGRRGHPRRRPVHRVPPGHAAR